MADQNSTHFTSTKDQVANLFKELQDILDQNSTHFTSTKLVDQVANLFKELQDILDQNSTHFTSTKNQVVNLFNELQDILNKFLNLLIALIAATNTDSGKKFFMEQDKLMKPLLVTIVLYSFFAIIGTILHIYNGTLLPIIICAMLIVGAAASFLALSFISTTLAWITLAMWLGIFILFAYDYGVPQRINNWIKDRIN